MEIRKQCTRCKEWKKAEDFYKRAKSYDGLTHMCKECIKRRQSKYYHSGRGKEKLKEYRETAKGKMALYQANVRYENSDKGKQTRKEYRKSNRGKEAIKRYEQSEKRKEYKRQYQKTKQRKTYQKQYGKRLWDNRKEQRQANNAVNTAVRYGKIPRPSTLTCMNCGEQAQEYHHHKGYSQEHWLDVVPLCIKCHRQIDQ